MNEMDKKRKDEKTTLEKIKEENFHKQVIENAKLFLIKHKKIFDELAK